MTVLTRPATDDDSPVAVDVLRRSIVELCHDDHGNDPSEIAAWLHNKTTETWRSWVNNPDLSVLVAEEDGVVRGVGMATITGYILLNYVHPDARFRGVGKAVMDALEREAGLRGVERTTLETTRTARRFYLARGYRPIVGAAPGLLEKIISASD